MDTPHLAPSAAPLSSPVTPPWEAEPAESARPFAAAPRKPRAATEPRIVAEPIPWAIVALTLATAVLVAFGAWTGGAPDSRVMTFADQPAD